MLLRLRVEGLKHIKNYCIVNWPEQFEFLSLIKLVFKHELCEFAAGLDFGNSGSKGTWYF